MIGGKKGVIMEGNREEVQRSREMRDVNWKNGSCCLRTGGGFLFFGGGVSSGTPPRVLIVSLWPPHF